MKARRPLFILTILVGSFLLFLVQPMIARAALPRLGGAPNVWNSAMVVYQVLLLGGYAYAHLIARLTIRRQVAMHLAMMLMAALTLPVGLASLPPPKPGWEVLWVPLLLGASIGPVFLVVSAQAPLMQRWFAADPQAGEPWGLYAASNLGSFAGLLAYPLLAEPLLSLHAQEIGWSAGYAVLVMLVAIAATSRWAAPEPIAKTDDCEATGDPAPGWRRILFWLILAAVPSGLMLSTTTHLTTDLFAMPLLWVIPLGLYLLSFVIAFADDRRATKLVTLLAPAVLFFAGSYSMISGSGTLMVGVGSCVMLFVVAVDLHGRMYDLRPAASRLTQFYFVMSAGGALGGAFTALVAPVAFDWVWEHPILILAALLLLPMPSRLNWWGRGGVDPALGRIALGCLIIGGLFLSGLLLSLRGETGSTLHGIFLSVLLTGIGVLLLPWRLLAALLLLCMMVAQGGLSTIQTSAKSMRTRSYFGIYTIHDRADARMLAHGTTLHGKQSRLPGREHAPTTYYGDTSGVGIALDAAPKLFGPHSRIGIVGLGTGTLACRYRRGQSWTVFEIDPVVLRYSRNGTFTFLKDCAPRAKVMIGDARLGLAAQKADSFDVLAIDAFSSDSIPLHLLTSEAVGIYEHSLAPDGLLLVHISNRFIDLQPVLAAIARDRKLVARIRKDAPSDAENLLTPSNWVALAHNPATMEKLEKSQPNLEWEPLKPPARHAWTDDYASIVPYIRWDSLVR